MDPSAFGRQRPKKNVSTWSVLLVVAAMFWSIGGYFRWLRVDNGKSALAVVELRNSENLGAETSIPRSDREDISRKDLDETEQHLSAKRNEQGLGEGVREGSREDWGEFDRRWLKTIPEPESVTYMIKTGGTLRRVANLFKIHYREILALNPTLNLDDELSANEVVVIARRDPGEVSESIGFPDGGSLSGAIPMLEGPGRVIRSIPWKTWATASTVGILDRVFEEWANRYGDSSPLLVGNLSQRHGGKLAPHDTHRSGRDMDIGYVLKPQIYEDIRWRKVDEQNLDVRGTWQFLGLLVGTGQVELIYIDTEIQRQLYDYARDQKLFPDSELKQWLEYPRRPGSIDARIVHSRGHDDHMHIRFVCPKSQLRCKSRDRD